MEINKRTLYWSSLFKKEKPYRNWHYINAEGLTLGRLASKVSHVLQGKHKPIFTKHIPIGDFVVVTNMSRVILTGKKMGSKKSIDIILVIQVD